MTVESFIGRKIGRLLIFDRLDHSVPPMWHCRCDCGTLVWRSSGSFRRKGEVSCGCVRKAIIIREFRACNTTHGLRGSGKAPGTYRSWQGMIQRCCNPNDRGYSYYGGRGISVCDRWRHDYAAFLSDMGPRPAGLTLDRIEVNGNYEPGNCRWATPLVQSQNRRPSSEWRPSRRVYARR